MAFIVLWWVSYDCSVLIESIPIELRLERALFHLKKIIKLIVLLFEFLNMMLVLFSFADEIFANHWSFTFWNALRWSLFGKCHIGDGLEILFVLKTCIGRIYIFI